MLRNVLIGTIAGAAGTVALDIAGYADMAIRGRSSSNAPAKLVEKLANMAHLPLSTRAAGSNDQAVQNRESGLGAVLGYVNGLATGALYGLLRSQLEEVPVPLAGVVVGLAAMAESDVPLIMLRVSDPKTWGFSGWFADIIPHLVYGMVTVLTYETLSKRE